ncbi:MAG: carboxylesterase family protein [Deltaproteobacteria bacterium]|nr:carboxylesterase family protein [Deltaproteobacteria bacterium]
MEAWSWPVCLLLCVSLAGTMGACGSDPAGDAGNDGDTLDTPAEAVDGDVPDDAAEEEPGTEDAPLPEATDADDAGGCLELPDPAPGEVNTASGPARGTLADGAWSWKGIPYAAPPIGDRRWRLPDPFGCWDGVRDGSAYGPLCPQYDDAGAVVGEEDCLQLNVWAPLDAPPGSRSVMVYIHGGGHEQGSGTKTMYDGTSLAAERGVVVVTVNYRLGPFGFLAHPALTAEGGEAASGNYGMHDQLAALRWVRDNIRGFGGDPSRTLIFGQSAGAVSVCRLVASPLAAGLFHAAVMHSGGCVATPLADAEALGEGYVTRMGCGDAADVPACLRGLAAGSVMAGFDPAGSGTGTLGRLNFDGVVDGYALPDAPRALIEAGAHNAVPMIVGSTSEENGRNAPAVADEAAFRSALATFLGSVSLPAEIVDEVVALYPVAEYGSWRAAYVAVTSDVKFTCTARMEARALAAAGTAPVFRYLFDDVPDRAGGPLLTAGSFHGLDMFYAFGTLDQLTVTVPAGDQATIDSMQGYWTTLAADGAPGAAGGPDWPRYSSTDERVVVFLDGATLSPDPRAAPCDFWDALRP